MCDKATFSYAHFLCRRLNEVGCKLACSCWLVKALTTFIFAIVNIQGRESFIGEFMNNTFNIGLPSDTFEPVSFKLVIITDTTKIIKFDTSCNDLDLHSRSQGYEKSRICAELYSSVKWREEDKAVCLV